jgi:hypothetical protein
VPKLTTAEFSEWPASFSWARSKSQTVLPAARRLPLAGIAPVYANSKASARLVFGRLRHGHHQRHQANAIN